MNEWIEGIPTESGPYWIMGDDGEVKFADVSTGAEQSYYFGVGCEYTCEFNEGPYWHQKAEVPDRPAVYIPQPTIHICDIGMGWDGTYREWRGTRYGRALQGVRDRGSNGKILISAEAWTPEYAELLAKTTYADRTKQEATS